MYHLIAGNFVGNSLRVSIDRHEHEHKKVAFL